MQSLATVILEGTSNLGCSTLEYLLNPSPSTDQKGISSIMTIFASAL